MLNVLNAKPLPFPVGHYNDDVFRHEALLESLDGWQEVREERRMLHVLNSYPPPPEAVVVWES